MSGKALINYELTNTDAEIFSNYTQLNKSFSVLLICQFSFNQFVIAGRIVFRQCFHHFAHGLHFLLHDQNLPTNLRRKHHHEFHKCYVKCNRLLQFLLH